MKLCPLLEGRVHLGLSEVAFIEVCPHIRGGLYRGVLTSGVAFIEVCPHIRGGLYRGVSSHQGGLYRGVSSHQGWPL